MKTRLLLYIAGFCILFCTECKKPSSYNSIQQKGKSQTCLLQLLQQIDSLTVLGEYDEEVTKQFIIGVEEFSTQYPESPMTAEFLYKAGLMAMVVAQSTDICEEKKHYSHKALIIFDDIQLTYPDFCDIKNCIFNKGFIYSDILKDYKNAEFYYREFIARYPADTLVINIETYLHYFGKASEDILDERN